MPNVVENYDPGTAPSSKVRFGRTSADVLFGIRNVYSLTPGFLVLPYQAAWSSQRLARRLEIQESQQISECIRGIVTDGAAIADAPARVMAAFVDRKGIDHADLAEIFKERLKNLNPTQAVIYGLDDYEDASWLDNGSPGS